MSRCEGSIIEGGKPERREHCWQSVSAAHGTVLVDSLNVGGEAWGKRTDSLVAFCSRELPGIEELLKTPFDKTLINENNRSNAVAWALTKD